VKKILGIVVLTFLWGGLGYSVETNPDKALKALKHVGKIANLSILT
jgi:hypothetical protein